MKNKFKFLSLFCLSGALLATLSACSSTGTSNKTPIHSQQQEQNKKSKRI